MDRMCVVLDVAPWPLGFVGITERDLAFIPRVVTGGAIMRAASPNVKSLSFEHGGKNAEIIFDDTIFNIKSDTLLRGSTHDFLNRLTLHKQIH